MLKVLGVVCACVCVIAAVAAGQSAPSAADRSAIARARNMYYSLQRQGVRELRCNAYPDWPQILASMLGTNADARARALPYLSKTNFSVVMTESSTDVKVDRTDEQPPEGLANLGKLVELVRVSIQQPLDDWRMFTFQPLIPESEGDYRLEHRSGTYKITPNGVKDGQIELDENWIIREIRRSEPVHVTISMQPHYARNPDGLLLSSLDERNIDEPAQQIQMTFEYLEQEGLHLPAAFGSNSQDPGGAVSIPVRFDHYQIKRLSQPTPGQPVIAVNLGLTYQEHRHFPRACFNWSAEAEYRAASFVSAIA
jgi:hypothetical protein